MDQHVMAVIGITAGFLQAIIIFILASIKKDQAIMWKRMDNHYHEIECQNHECTALRTGNVVIPGAR